VLGALPVAAIDAGLVVRCLEPIWSAKTETASRVRGRIEAVLDWAKAMGYRRGENPAAWKGNLAHALPKRSEVAAVSHHAALPYAELAAFMAELRQRDGMAARALEWTILTACRTGEAIGATWGEFDEEARTWTIPAERMKAGREHRVPLSEPALALLARVDRTGSRIFPLSNMAMAMTLRRMGRGDLTVHGFRSSFKDWASEQTSTPREIVETALAHVNGDRVEAAYARSDLLAKRRDMAERWATFCDGPREAKVIPLRSAV